MSPRTAAIAMGLATMLWTGGAYAQAGPPPSQQGPTPAQGVSGPMHARQGKRAQIREDLRAGRISKAQAKQLRQQLRAEKAQRRAQKQARRGQGNYQPTNYPSPPSPQ